MAHCIKAIIPVRNGSKRVLNKNIRSFANSSLLEIKIKQLLSVRGLDGVCVNSNDPDMLRIAESMGAEVVLRDEYYASDSIPMSDVYANMANAIDADVILLTHVTNPLAMPSHYEEVLRAYVEKASSHDSVTTVGDVKEFLYRDGLPLNFDPFQKPRSQDLPDIVRLTHVASVLPRKVMISKRDSSGYTPNYVRLDSIASLDIDTPLDFEIAEYLYRTKVLNEKINYSK